MNLTSLGILSASVVVGVVGAGAAYQLTSVDVQEQASGSAPAPAAPATQGAQPPTRWAPCDPPAVLEGKECVVEVIQTVTLPGEPAAANPVSAPVPTRAAATSATVPGADAPGTQESHSADTAPTSEAGDDCDVREDHDKERGDCDDRDHDTSGSDHDDSTEDAEDAADDAADDAEDDREDEDD